VLTGFVKLVAFQEKWLAISFAGIEGSTSPDYCSTIVLHRSGSVRRRECVIRPIETIVRDGHVIWNNGSNVRIAIVTQESAHGCQNCQK
jgi:hypothetical protein